MTHPTLLLYPGAGTHAAHSSLLAIESQTLSLTSVERRDFPYRKAGRRIPDRAPTLMAAIRNDLTSLPQRGGPLVMGGRSMGARMTTMVAADVDSEGPVDGLVGMVLVCYPLHPPGKPKNLRAKHLPEVRVPCLFISGTKDPFGSPSELTEWTATIPAPVEHVWIVGKGHDLRDADGDVALAVREFVASLV